MEQCPICDTKFPQGKVNYCSTCGWDLTPYPIGFELPEYFAQKEQDKIYWARALWQKMESQLGQYKSEFSQLQSDLQTKTKELEEQLNSSHSKSFHLQTEKERLELERKNLLSQIKQLNQELSNVKNELSQLQQFIIARNSGGKKDMWEL